MAKIVSQRSIITSERVIGKTVIVGITKTDADGNVVKKIQHFGLFAAMDSLIHITLDPSGEDFTLPPDMTAFEWAEPGIYRLRCDGREVENPDLLATWTVHEKRKGIHNQKANQGMHPIEHKG